MAPAICRKCYRTLNAKEVYSRASLILNCHLLILQHHRHHPLRCRIKRSTEFKTRLHPCPPFDWRFGQRQKLDASF